jgi:hypothetical protein
MTDDPAVVPTDDLADVAVRAVEARGAYLADRESERRVRSVVDEAYPHHAVSTEERGDRPLSAGTVGIVVGQPVLAGGRSPSSAPTSRSARACGRPRGARSPTGQTSWTVTSRSPPPASTVSMVVRSAGGAPVPLPVALVLHRLSRRIPRGD